VLAEDDDPDLRVRRPQLPRQANAFVGVRRRHPDVGHDDIGGFSLDSRSKLVEIDAGRDELDVLDRLQYARNPFACEKAVVA